MNKETQLKAEIEEIENSLIMKGHNRKDVIKEIEDPFQEVQVQLRDQYNKAKAELKGIQEGKQIQKQIEIEWLQSVMDTKHMSENNKWIIEGRISKLKGEIENG